MMDAKELIEWLLDEYVEQCDYCGGTGEPQQMYHDDERCSHCKGLGELFRDSISCEIHAMRKLIK